MSLRVVTGLVAATVAALVCALGFGTNNALAGTPQEPDITQAVATPATATPAPAVEVPATGAPLATAQESGSSAPTPPAEDAPAVKSPQQVVNDQTAGADSSATQDQPVNLVISIRIDSPGDDGPISQANVVVAGANGANGASTEQGSGSSGQNASTDQQAAANTTVSQDNAGNYVVVVRINSPGNNGPVSQTNAAAATSNAQNTSSTSQGQQSDAPAAPSGAPKKAPAGSSTGTSRRRPRQDASPIAPRQESVTAAPTQTVVPASASHDSGTTSASAARARHASHVASDRPKHGTTVAGRSPGSARVSASPLSAAIGRVGDALGTVAPRGPIGATRPPAGFASSVFYSLLAALGLSAVFVAWSMRPRWPRRRRFRNGLLP
jgi:hypothetical protein